MIESKPTFYSLPAHTLETGMCTDDGQVILKVSKHEDEDCVVATVYTPDDDPEQDAQNRLDDHMRLYDWNRLVDLLADEGTEVDGSGYDQAQLIRR
ncbi:hypothetical protein [Saccharopolyspora shandongensis]|uniref:hypothetical protein n=1 Tax=Saccharopolyspora shandongensis TaxID=418495 RepID=UPI0033CB5549